MSAPDSRSFSRPVGVIVVAWLAAAVFALNAVLNLVWFGELPPQNLLLPALWAAIATAYTFPYVVITEAGVTIRVTPIRVSKLQWSEISSSREAKPGITELTLGSGHKLLVRVKDVRKEERQLLVSELERGIASATLLNPPATAG